MKNTILVPCTIDRGKSVEGETVKAVFGTCWWMFKKLVVFALMLFWLISVMFF